MKKLAVLLAVLFAVPAISMAQSKDELVKENEKLKKENKMLRQYLPLKRPWIINSYKRAMPYPITVGLFGFGSFGYVSRDGHSYSPESGGLGFRTKISFKSWIALSVDLLGDIGLDSFEFRPMAVFQKETRRGQKGFAPYGGIGLALGNYNGVVLNGGIRYNTTQNMFVGTEIALGLGARDWGGKSAFAFDSKIGVEVGYRF